MSAFSLINPFAIFSDTSGLPLDAGYVYIGTEGLNPETNPIQVYWDSALSIPAAQPLRTIGGYVSRNGSPSKVYVNAENFSITVKTSVGQLVWSSIVQNSLAASTGSSLIGFIAAGTGAVARTAQDKMREFVSVKDFGAVGDGVTDDGPAVQLAIDEMASRGRGTIVFPAGYSYFMNTQVNVYDNLTVVGYGARIIAGRGYAHIDAPLFKNFAAAKMSEPPGTVTATSNVAFYGLEFDGQDTGGLAGVPNANMHGIFICMGNRTDVNSGVNGFTVQDCYLHDLDGAGILTYSGQNINISDNRFVNFFPNAGLSIGSGLQLTDVDGFVVDANVFDHAGANWSWHGMTVLDFNNRSKNGTVSNNVVRNMNNGDGISCEGNTSDNLENVTFVGNMIRDCAGDGIGVDNCLQTVVSGNTIQDVGGVGILIGQTERLIITGNSLINIGSTAIYGSGDKITITGNSITGTSYVDATYQGDGISIVPTAPSTSNSAEITGNYFKDIDGAGVILAENGIAVGNFFYNVGRNPSSNRRIGVIGGETSVISNNVFQSIGNTDRAISCASNPPTIKNNQILGTYLDCKIYIGFRNNVSTGLALNQDRIESDGPTDQMTIWDTTTPAVGYWLQGDIVYNTAPAAGGFIGWVCVSTPSTWKTWGAITP